ncbi:glycosyltransferase [Bradyrhizobium sp. 183]|uniref:glycosyltransferase n=1 Tax=unclassified Bradyrhizobium TaxID=2631580 RepID=UPI001FFFC117|nr:MULTISPECIES: glycosyltransferase [unclassified Bradyrhizobium]UPJ78942.1 glycosyltransferase [Bradyrhizobium sp. 184]UPJ86735.1 glycosyltransferase [Bradyrhizobium sp. 183]
MSREGVHSISVVIPAYNAGAYLAATLQSIVSQDAEAVEVILVDGNSSDDTLTIAFAFPDLCIKVISEPDAGQLDALQKGVRLATGDIVLWLNADDIVMPGAFSEVRAIFAKYDVDFVYSDDVAFLEENRGYYYGPSITGLSDLDHFLFYRQLYSECVYWKRSVTRYLPNEAFAFRVYTDYAFFLRLRWGRRGLWINKRLGAFRVRSGQASAKYSARKRSEYIAVKKMHRQYIGMSAAVFNLRRCLYWPWFFVRQQLRPQLQRGVRRLLRLLTNDRARKNEAFYFYSEWLLGEGSRGPRYDHDKVG